MENIYGGTIYIWRYNTSDSDSFHPQGHYVIKQHFQHLYTEMDFRIFVGLL